MVFKMSLNLWGAVPQGASQGVEHYRQRGQGHTRSVEDELKLRNRGAQCHRRVAAVGEARA